MPNSNSELLLPEVHVLVSTEFSDRHLLPLDFPAHVSNCPYTVRSNQSHGVMSEKCLCFLAFSIKYLMWTDKTL